MQYGILDIAIDSFEHSLFMQNYGIFAIMQNRWLVPSLECSQICGDSEMVLKLGTNGVSRIVMSLYEDCNRTDD